jgi:hypothetical protein
MVLTDEDVFSKARRAYEAARVRFGVVASLVVALVPLASLGLGGHAASAALLGSLLVVGVGTMVWRGGLLSLSAMSGLKAGLVPLVLAHAANLYGHVCIPGQGCSTLCVPACSVGGLLAGFLVERVARRSPRPNVIRIGGAAVAFATGALGCFCVGSGGVIGLSLGMAFTFLASRFLQDRPA